VLARISDRARALACALVIIGDRATPAECAALAELDAAEDAVDELVAAGVLAEDADLRFRHPLIAAAVTAGMPPTRRAAWHARAAVLVQSSGGDVERLAMHLAACPLPRTARSRTSSSMPPRARSRAPRRRPPRHCCAAHCESRPRRRRDLGCC